MSKPLKPEAPAPQQRTFVSSVHLQTGGIKPFTRVHYQQFKKHPAWPKPFLGENGRQIYVWEEVEAFLRLIAKTGFDFGQVKPKSRARKTKTKSERPIRRKHAAPDRAIVANT